MSASNTTSAHDRALSALQIACEEASDNFSTVSEAIDHLDGIIGERDEEIKRLQEEIMSLENEINALRDAK